MRKTLLHLLVFTILAGCSKSDNEPANALPVAYHNKGTGASAHDLLSADAYTSLKIEIQYMPGYRPQDAAVTHLVSLLNARLNKPGGMQVVYREVPASDKEVLSVDEIAALEKQYRTVYTSGKELGIYFLFTNGGYTQSNVLGIAYRNTSMCLFGKTLHDNSGGVGQVSRSNLQATVAEHELGHLLGLVDIGSPMQTPHKDPDHGNHCSTQDCLMYYASETTAILGFLPGNDIPVFDNACLADLQANGGR
ncbi:zinc metalloprotease [Chitinophaga japonensis]|uniref:Reprolysin-like metallo-peptidase family M12B n=1 Tax=Chitinophaga japonensis TaxID=104662 RepID=A0A562T6H3_CHIJA|nr:hypothetical protein [Chitinophaga japonensis]TWI89125.1 hypothetical protein LX66_3219 [Chitinophaga japonensis]